MDQDKKVACIVIVLIIILVAAIIGMWYYQKQRYSDVFFEYNGFPIHKVQQQNSEVYQIEVESLDGKIYLITSRNSPRDLETIPFEKEVLDKIFNKQVLYVTMPINATSISVIAYGEIAKITGNPLIFKTPILSHGAFLEGSEGKNVTIKTCDDVDETNGVIEFRYGDENGIYSEEDCVITEAKSEYDLIKLANRLTLTMIGIMKP